MITGAHSIIYSKNPERDREFLRDVLGLPCIDSGGGWLIFALPPSEVAVHPADENDQEELYFLCDDIRAFVREMEQRKVKCTKVSRQSWGLLTKVRLPGGGSLKIYEPLHERPGSAVL